MPQVMTARQRAWIIALFVVLSLVLIVWVLSQTPGIAMVQSLKELTGTYSG
jgi:multisubunit Na+/H+ antiporter MnhB subunit